MKVIKPSTEKAPLQNKDAVVTTVSNFEIISNALDDYGKRQKVAGDWRMVICPFHADGNERTPSCGILMTRGPKLGFYNCLGCQARGSWNEFASTIRAPTIQEWKNEEDADPDGVIRDTEDQFLGQTIGTFKSVLQKMGHTEAQRWPKTLQWRGFSGHFLHTLGAHIIDDRYAQTIGILFPVKIGSIVHGAVKGTEHKKGERGSKVFADDEAKVSSTSYLTMKGSWVRTFGLFPYVYVKGLLEAALKDRRASKTSKPLVKFVVLVEGPRDALRLCLRGIPALCVFGTHTATKSKLLVLSGLGLSSVVVLGDNDEAGRKFGITVKKLCKEAQLPFDVLVVELPEKYKNSKGKVIKGKLDPGDMPEKMLEEFCSLLQTRYSFTARPFAAKA